MGVRVHEAGKNHAAPGVEFACAPRSGKLFNMAASADGGDFAVVNQQRAIFDNPNLAEIPPSARR
jgi:hypothetical protein